MDAKLSELFPHIISLQISRSPLPFAPNGAECGEFSRVARVTMRDSRCTCRRQEVFRCRGNTIGLVHCVCVYSFAPATQDLAHFIQIPSAYGRDGREEEEGLAKSTFLPSSFCRLSEPYNSRQLQRSGSPALTAFRKMWIVRVNAQPPPNRLTLCSSEMYFIFNM